ncbi:rhodanese-like domain-containing protein [Sporichthya sp.]|uniref:rhodanese-like domain-containing protein n=1 Tax=Sporichthya sp. TaxID=65475 RepID=UPI0018455973|nr:rhodanese-like domain-containing protein [Sporichthya sp.]MBA3743948.1 rhodanese-like domain-containing protein [Sporichthya sp.]
MPPHVPEIEVSGIPADAYLLDVREPVEWTAGHVEGAAHIPMNDVPARIAEIPEEGEIYVICKSGGRSAQVTAYLGQQGRRASNIAGGMLAWATSGKPMVSESGESPHVY